MKNSFAYLITMSCLLSFCIFSACQSSTSNDTQQNGENPSDFISSVLPVAAFEKLLKSKPEAQLVDVRTQEEIAGGMIEGALHYDFHQTDFQSKLEKLDPQKPVFVYCKSGGRSGKTVGILKGMGFKEVYDLKGGYTDWKSEH